LICPCSFSSDVNCDVVQSSKRRVLTGASLDWCSEMDEGSCTCSFTCWNHQLFSLMSQTDWTTIWLFSFPLRYSDVLPKPSGPSWLVELRYGRNHQGSIPRWSELWGWFKKKSPRRWNRGSGGFLSRWKVLSS
jgi:hypothetical protein